MKRPASITLDELVSYVNEQASSPKNEDFEPEVDEQSSPLPQEEPTKFEKEAQIEVINSQFPLNKAIGSKRVQFNSQVN